MECCFRRLLDHHFAGSVICSLQSFDLKMSETFIHSFLANKFPYIASYFESASRKYHCS